MKNVKTAIATMLVSAALVSASANAGGPTVKPPPAQQAMVTTTSFSVWFASVFNF